MSLGHWDLRVRLSCHLLKERTVRGDTDLLCTCLPTLLLIQRNCLGQACEQCPGIVLGPVIPLWWQEWLAGAVHSGSLLESG